MDLIVLVDDAVADPALTDPTQKVEDVETVDQLFLLRGVLRDFHAFCLSRNSSKDEWARKFDLENDIILHRFSLSESGRGDDERLGEQAKSIIGFIKSAIKDREPLDSITFMLDLCLLPSENNHALSNALKGDYAGVYLSRLLRGLIEDEKWEGVKIRYIFMTSAIDYYSMTKNNDSLNRLLKEKSDCMAIYKPLKRNTAGAYYVREDQSINFELESFLGKKTKYYKTAFSLAAFYEAMNKDSRS